MLVTPILLGLLIAVCFGASDYLSKDVTRQIGYFKTTVYILVLSGGGVLLMAPLIGLSYNIGAPTVGLLIFISVVNFVGFIFLYRGFRTGMLSVVSPIVNSFPAVTTVISILLIGGSLTATTTETLAIIMVGIVLVSTHASELAGQLKGHSKKLSAGVGSAIAASVLFGVTWAAFGYAEKNAGYLFSVLFMRMGAAVIGFLVAPVLKQQIRPVSGDVSRRLLLMGVLETVGVFTFALNLGQISGGGSIPIVSTFAGMGVVFTVALAVMILKERVEVNQAAGILLLIVGVASLLYLTS